MTQAETRADIGVIGGSGCYELLSGAEQVTVETPYGDPSDTISVGTVGSRRLAFLPRHGRHHRYAPHTINYRANLWARWSTGPAVGYRLSTTRALSMCPSRTRTAAMGAPPS